MLSEQQITDHLRRLSYKPGWTFRVKRHPHEGLQIRIVAEGLPDSYNPSQTIDIGVDPFLPPMVDTFYVERFMKYRLERIEIHETLEWLKRDGKPIWDPHASA